MAHNPATESTGAQGRNKPNSETGTHPGIPQVPLFHTRVYLSLIHTRVYLRVDPSLHTRVYLRVDTSLYTLGIPTWEVYSPLYTLGIPTREVYTSLIHPGYTHLRERNTPLHTLGIPT